MFVPTTNHLRAVAPRFPHVVAQLEAVFEAGRAGVYVDWANVRNWSEVLKWHVDLEKLKYLLDSFTATKYPRFYWGTLDNAPKSIETITQADKLGFYVRTKPVKRIRVPIDVSRLSSIESTAILQDFVSSSLLKLLPLGNAKQLNDALRELNRAGIKEIENLKCNFDVEIATDMRGDFEKNDVKNFLLWSGDSDFADTVEHLLKSGSTLTVFSTRGRLARELSDLRTEGLRIFEVNGLREFLCWNREKSIRSKSVGLP